jgi:hypothetical protein
MLTRSQFLVLWNAENSYGTDIERSAMITGITTGETQIIVRALEEKGFLRLEYREGMLYCFIATPKGREEMAKEEYEGWKC